MKRKATLTEQDIAAIASGALHSEQFALEEQAQQTDMTAEGAAEVVAETAETVAQEDATPVEAQEEKSPLIDLLQSQLKEASDELVQTKVALAQSQKELDALKPQQEAMLAIVRDSARKMYVALGQAGDHIEALSADALLSEHSAVSKVFQNKFKVGGVAASAVNTEEAKKTNSVDSRQKARLNATRTK